MTFVSTKAKEELYRALSIARDLDWDDPVLRGESEYGIYALMRRCLPAAYSEKVREWFFFSYDDCNEAFQRPEIFSSDTKKRPLQHIPQQVDPPAHREYRRILEPFFAPQAMDRLEPDIRAFAIDLLKDIAQRGECEFIKGFAELFPTIIFCRLMGFPLDDRPMLMRWSHVFLHMASTVIVQQLGITDLEPSGRPPQAVVERLQRETAAEVVGYLTELLERKRREPGDDLLSGLLEARYAGERPISQEELINMSFLFFLAGLDTVTGMLGLVVRDFAEHPDRRERFIAIMNDGAKITSAVEGLVRFHSTVAPDRRVTQPCVFRGLVLKENDIVRLMTPSAGRDEDRFPKADELDFERHPNPHLGFGLRPHRCFGIHLARRELRIALQEIHRLMPEYALKEGDPPVAYTGGLRGLARLPLVIGRGCSAK
jgi:cytochrome P450